MLDQYLAPPAQPQRAPSIETLRTSRSSNALVPRGLAPSMLSHRADSEDVSSDVLTDDMADSDEQVGH